MQIGNRYSHSIVNVTPILADVFVSPTGNDSWSGTLPNPNVNNTDGPVATLHKARLLIQGMLSKNRDFIVMFRGGRYDLSAREVFTLADKPIGSHTVTYMNYPNERPVISGGKVISGWTVDGTTGFWTAYIQEVQDGTWYFGKAWQLVGLGAQRSPWTIRPLPGQDRFHVATQTSLTNITGLTQTASFTSGQANITVVDGTKWPFVGSHAMFTTAQAGYAAYTVYYVKTIAGNVITLSATNGGAAIVANATTTGTIASPPFFPSDPVQSVNAGDRFSSYGTNTFGFNSGEINSAWTNLTDIRIELSPDNANSSIVPLASVAGQTATLNSHLLNDPLRIGASWRRMNVYEDLGTNGQRGEFYLNRTTGIITYVPRLGETPANVTFMAPFLNQLILITNAANYGTTGSLVGNIKFKGIEFNYTNSTIYSKMADVSGNVGGMIGAVSNIYGNSDAAITTIGAANVTLDNCIMFRLGSAGIMFGPGSHDCTVSNSTFGDLGCGAIIAGNEPSFFNNFRFAGGEGPSTTLSNVGNFTIYNNLVRDLSVLVKGRAGIAVGRGSGNQITHNEVSNFPSFGILLGSDPGTQTDSLSFNNYIGYNHIHNCGEEAGIAGGSLAQDFGGLYVIGPQQGTGAQIGTIIEFNKIHDIYSSPYLCVLSDGSTQIGGVDSAGIYCDNNSSGMTIRKNLVYNTGNHLHVLRGMHHVVNNNIFYSDFGTKIFGNTGYIPKNYLPPNAPSGSELQSNYYNNVLAWVGTDATFDCPEGNGQLATTNIIADNNLFFNYALTITNYAKYANISVAQWQGTYLQDVHSIFNQDPLFTNPTAGDFSYSGGSPINSLSGFQAFSVATAGRI